MKDRKRRFVTFTFYDRTSIENYLEKQAAEGWLLEKTSAFGWVFRRIEPAKLHFAVTYFPGASAFDPGPSDRQLRFQEFCAHTGWELIASNAQIQIFCNRRENPIPIETDPEIELENIHASVKKSFLPAYFTDLFLAFMQIVLFFQRFQWDPIGALASTTSLLSLALWVLLIIATGSELVLYFRWLHRAKKAAREGRFLETKSTVSFQYSILGLSILALICLALSYSSRAIALSMAATVVGILVITGFIVLLSELMKKRKVSTAANRGFTFGLAILLTVGFCAVLISWIFGGIREDTYLRGGAETYEYNGWTFVEYHDDIPLTIEDLMETDYPDYSYVAETDESSFLLSRFEAYQDPRLSDLEQPELHYHVVTVKVPGLYDLCMEQMREEFSHNYGYPEDTEGWEVHQAVDPAPWDADAAYQLILGGEVQERYLLCYEDRIVEIDFSWTPTEAQMEVVGQILGTP